MNIQAMSENDPRRCAYNLDSYQWVVQMMGSIEVQHAISYYNLIVDSMYEITAENFGVIRDGTKYTSDIRGVVLNTLPWMAAFGVVPVSLFYRNYKGETMDPGEYATWYTNYLYYALECAYTDYTARQSEPDEIKNDAPDTDADNSGELGGEAKPDSEGVGGEGDETKPTQKKKPRVRTGDRTCGVARGALGEHDTVLDTLGGGVHRRARMYGVDRKRLYGNDTIDHAHAILYLLYRDRCDDAETMLAETLGECAIAFLNKTTLTLIANAAEHLIMTDAEVPVYSDAPTYVDAKFLYAQPILCPADSGRIVVSHADGPPKYTWSHFSMEKDSISGGFNDIPNGALYTKNAVTFVVSSGISSFSMMTRAFPFESLLIRLLDSYKAHLIEQSLYEQQSILRSNFTYFERPDDISSSTQDEIKRAGCYIPARTIGRNQMKAMQDIVKNTADMDNMYAGALKRRRTEEDDHAMNQNQKLYPMHNKRPRIPKPEDPRVITTAPRHHTTHFLAPDIHKRSTDFPDGVKDLFYMPLDRSMLGAKNSNMNTLMEKQTFMSYLLLKKVAKGMGSFCELLEENIRSHIASEISTILHTTVEEHARLFCNLCKRSGNTGSNGCGWSDVSSRQELHDDNGGVRESTTDGIGNIVSYCDSSAFARCITEDINNTPVPNIMFSIFFKKVGEVPLWLRNEA